MKRTLVFLVTISYGMELPLSQKKMIDSLPIEYQLPVRTFSVFETKKAGLLYGTWYLKYRSKEYLVEIPSEIIDKILDQYMPLFFYKFKKIKQLPNFSFEYWQLDPNAGVLVSSAGVVKKISDDVFAKVFWLRVKSEKEHESSCIDEGNNFVLSRHINPQLPAVYVLPEICKDAHFDLLAFSDDKKQVYLSYNVNNIMSLCHYVISYLLPLYGKSLAIEYKKNSDLWKEQMWQSL